MNGPVFLSASEPSPMRDSVYWESQNLARIRAAVRALCAHVLPGNPIVFGGHPAITPLVRGIAKRIDHDGRLLGKDAGASRVVTFRSRLYGDDDTPGTIMVDAFDAEGNVVAPDKGRRNMSLLRMRYEMLGRPFRPDLQATMGDPERIGAARMDALGTLDYRAAVFIGGMEGVEREFRIFRAFHPHTPVYPIATTGAAAKRILDQVDGMPGRLQSYLSAEHAYGVLFQHVLNDGPEPWWRPAETDASWSEHVDPDDLDPDPQDDARPSPF